MLLGACAELLTLGAVLPFLALIADPTYVLKHRQIGVVLALLGFNGHQSLIAAAAALLCLIAVMAASVRIVLTWASQKFVFRLGFDIGVALYRRILYQPYSFHVNTHSGDIGSSVTKIQQVLNQALLPLLQCITSLIITSFILVGLILIDAPIAFGSAVGLGLIYVAVSYLSRRRLKINSQLIAKANAMRMKTVQEGLGAIRDVIIDQSQPIYLDRFIRIDTELRNAQATNALIGATPRFVIEGLGLVTIVLIASRLSRQPGGIVAALPVLGALALGAQRLLPLMQQVYSGWASIAGSRGTLNDVLMFLDHPLPKNIVERSAMMPLAFNKTITMEGVQFRYGHGSIVLNELNLSIKKGQRIGFIGKTGCGKSTILDLVMGLLTPSAGTIKIDGLVLTEGLIPNWQIQIAHVPQQIYLSDSSFLENIAFGVSNEQIDKARVRDAARTAELHDFILQQPGGYASVVGERGVRLSGGQRQRIGIARALYKRLPLLVLDEATSALDAVTERSVMDAIAKIGDDVTVLIIAHRLTSLRDCDVIYRLENGCFVERGSYADVVGQA